MLHENLGLSEHFVDELFPFHLLISVDDERRLLSAGSAIRKVLPDDYSQYKFDDYFSITRPSAEVLSADLIDRSGGCIVFISVVGSDTVLRGQFVSTSPGMCLFLGTLLVDAADSLANSGFSLADFAAFDATPDIVILQRFREIQLKGMEQQNQKLKKVIVDRDAFDKNANTDMLTDLANRRGFWALGEKWLKQAGDSTKAVLLLDVDRFKMVNDSFGHEAGDIVLQFVGSRLCEVLQASGVPGRLGGDEFAVLIGTSDLDLLEKRINEIVDAVEKPVLYNETEIVSTVSMGVALADTGIGLDELIRRADMAMYRGRSVRQGQVHWYTEELRKKNEHNKKLTYDLEKAIEERNIRPVYQPIIRLNDLQLVSFEVLARWEHPEIGFIGPDVFIDLAQKAGLLRRLDLLMLESALDQLAQWRSQGKQHSIHVNICGPSIHSELPAIVRDNLLQRNLTAGSLNLELTETTLIDDSRETKAILTELAGDGVSLHLDDFGTGYSSLTHLQDFPVSGIKIDRSFVAKAHECKRAGSLLFAVADIATHLELEVVGEGIETNEQLSLLKTVGCHYGQGYFLGRPASAEACESFQFPVAKAAA